MASWDETEYKVLFDGYPPTEPTAPTAAECVELAALLPRHSPEAIASQWQDGRSIVLGHTTDADQRLRDYLGRWG